MKFTIETKALSEALRIASVATMTGRSPLPILGNIKIEAIKDQIILSTTNLDIYVRQKLSAKVKKEGATTVPFSILSQLVARMQASTISIEQQKGAIEFKSGEVQAELETIDASEFPDPLPSSGEGVECDAADILIPFRKVFHAASDDTSRYALMGVNVNGEGEFIATDGRRIALWSGVKLTSESVIIADAFVRAITKIEPEGKVKVFVGSGAITLVSKDVDVGAKLLEATFPDGPKSVMVAFKCDQFLSCGRKPLIHALETCSIFSPLKNPGLYVTGNGKEVEVSQPGKALASVLGTELAGQPKLSFKINEHFIISALGFRCG